MDKVKLKEVNRLQRYFMGVEMGPTIAILVVIVISVLLVALFTL